MTMAVAAGASGWPKAHRTSNSARRRRARRGTQVSGNVVYQTSVRMGASYAKMNAMIRGERAVLLVAAIALSSCTNSPNVKVFAQTKADTGRIEGIVLYEDGRPVRTAIVTADPIDRGMAHKCVTQAEVQLGVPESGWSEAVLQNDENR